MQNIEYLEFKTSQRIKTLNSFIPPQAIVYDIACDHGLIGIYAFYVKQAKHVYLVDCSDAVIDKLRATKSKYFPENNHIEIMPMRGEDIAWISGEKYVILAGIGEQTIMSIVSQMVTSNDLTPLHLIISSHTGKNSYPKLLIEEKFQLKDKAIVFENDQEYVIEYWYRDS